MQTIAQGKKPRRSNRPTKKSAKHRHPETVTTDEDTDGSLPTLAVKSYKGVANFQPGPITHDDITTSHMNEQKAATLNAFNQEKEETPHKLQTAQHQDEIAQLRQQTEGERELDPHELQQTFINLCFSHEGNCGKSSFNHPKIFIL